VAARASRASATPEQGPVRLRPNAQSARATQPPCRVHAPALCESVGDLLGDDERPVVGPAEGALRGAHLVWAERGAVRGGGVLFGGAPVATVASEGLRTVPARETAGNIEIKQLTPGVSMLLPVFVEGGLVSTGDVHYAQGDCEACGTAIEMRCRIHVSFQLRKGEAERRGIRDLQFFRDNYFAEPELAVPRRFHATTGISVVRDGRNKSEDVTSQRATHS